MLKRASLGRFAQIGDLYDVRSDSFCGMSIFSGTAGRTLTQMPTTVRTTDSKYSRVLVSDTLSHKLDALDAEEELQVSLLTGLTKSEGQTSAFLSCDHVDDSSVSGVLVHKLTIVEEEVEEDDYIRIPDFDNETEDVEIWYDAYDDQYSDALAFGDDVVVVNHNGIVATHVVVGISWGVLVAFRFKRPILQHLDRQVCLKELEKLLSDLAQHRGIDLNERDHAAYTTTVFSDVLTAKYQMVRTVQGAANLLRELPSALRNLNGGKGFPLSYIMIPLASGKQRTGLKALSMSWLVFGHIEQVLNKKLVQHFDSLSLAQNQVEHLLQLVNTHDKCLSWDTKRHISNFRSKFDAAVKSFRQKVGKGILDVRCKLTAVKYVDELLKDFDDGDFSIDKVRNFLKKHDHVIEKISFLEALRKEDVLCIANDDSKWQSNINSPDVYVLFANEKAKAEDRKLWNENCIAFFKIIKRQKHDITISHARNATLFIYVDGDFPSRHTLPVGIELHRYQYGQCVCRNVVEELAIISSMNIAQSYQNKETVNTLPRKRALLELPCPQSASNCDVAQRTWSCEICREQLEYGFDDFFYCACGKAPWKSFGFRCNGTSHGDKFVAFSAAAMQQRLREQTPITELNILFLGETGVGKSTWINGFANYLSFSTLEEAERSEAVCLIPSKFTMTNENYEEVEITTGMDKNEDHQTGRSATQMPKSYVFRRGKMTVRIIDTPGIGDTRGIDQDKVNLQNIMTHLSNIDEINGICVLLKPNNARLTVMFSFCIKELLTHLHKDACKNIVFCFTNARSTFYRPGDTLPALRKLLTENNDISINLRRETIYCMDNESVRFLAALKQGVKFREEEKKNYSTSWETSVAETNRLLEYVSGLEPHKVKNTLSLNDTRRLIVQLSRPLAEITSTIQNNIGVVEQRQKEIKESMKHKAVLLQNLHIPAIDLDTEPLDHPRTVCTSPGCVQHIKIGGVEKTDYVRHCHPHCHITGAPTNTVNCVALQQCAAMNGQAWCQHCGCSWNVHMHITYECRQVQTQVVDTNVEKQIRDKDSNIKVIQQHLLALNNRVVDLENEKRQIAEVSAKFGCFLKHNAIAPYNDALADYLDHLITVERGKVSVGGDKKSLEGLEKMRIMYQEEIKILEVAIKNPNSKVRLPSPDGIGKLVTSLYHLPISGPMLQKAVKVAEWSTAKATEYSERTWTANRPMNQELPQKRQPLLNRAWNRLSCAFSSLTPSKR